MGIMGQTVLLNTSVAQPHALPKAALALRYLLLAGRGGGRRTRPAAVLQSRTPLTVPLVTSPASTNSACNFSLYAS